VKILTEKDRISYIMNESFWQKLKKPIIGMAPMDGITDFPFRRILTETAKPDVLYTEFISAEGYVRNPAAFEKTLYFEEKQRPIIAQIFGYTPYDFKETISRVSELNFDGIDINMGCPAKSVLENGAGGALIKNQKLAGNLIEASLKAIIKSGKKISLSVKTRIGIDKPIIEEWFSFLSGFPLSEITIHGRLLKDGHGGENNWEEIEKAGEILKRKNIICLGNGGIKTLTQAHGMVQKHNIDGVLIGQAALGNPWVFKKDFLPLEEDILKIILKHASYADKFYPPKRFLTVLKHFSWYPKYFENCKQLKIELLKTKNLNDVTNVIDKFGYF